MKLTLFWLVINLSISLYKKDNMAGRDLSLISTIHAGNLLCEWKLKYWVNIRSKETTSKISFNFCKKFKFSSVTQSGPTLCDPMNRGTPGLPVHHQLPEFTQTHVHRVGDAIQPSHPLSSPSPPAFNLSQHQGLFQWGSSSYQVPKVLEFQLQYQSFQWIFRTDFL